MPAPRFVHLRVHSEYSVSDSIVRIDSLVAAAAADGQGALALADSANVFGWVKFYRAARGKGIKPILGLDTWITNDAELSRVNREAESPFPDLPKIPGQAPGGAHPDHDHDHGGAPR